MPEFRLGFKISLFLSSYFPLWLIFLFTLIYPSGPALASHDVFNIPRYYAVTGLLLLLLIPLIVVIVLIWNTNRGSDPTYITVKDRENSTSEFALYAVTYIIPFLVDNFLQISKLFALTVMMITIGSIYIKSDMFHLNPILTLLGYRLYNVVDDRDNKYMMLTRRELPKNERIPANKFSSRLYIEKEPEKSRSHI